MSKEITYDELHKTLYYNREIGIFVWIIKRTGSGGIGSIAGCLGLDGYIRIAINGRLYLASRLAWLYVYGYFPENIIDHKDRIKHHNWIDNMRETSKQCNAINTGNPTNNTSGVKGVYWEPRRNKWNASVKINQKKKYLGSYKDFDNAVCARLAAEQCSNWSNCDSNSPAFQYVQKMFKEAE